MAIDQKVKTTLQGRPEWRYYDISDDNPEHYLFDSIINEFCMISGFEIFYYLPLFNWDNLYGEDPNTNLSERIVSKLIYQPQDENNIIETFGITSDETLSFAVTPKTMFTEDCSAVWYSTPSISANDIHPIPGMLIHTVWNDRLYEVVNVGDYQTIHQARKPVWEMILRPFRYSHQSIEHHQLLINSPSGSYNEPISASDGTLIYDDLLMFSDNEMIKEESDLVDSYSDVDMTQFGR